MQTQEQPAATASWTIEPHGKGFALYAGRGNMQHGLNLVHLSEPDCNWEATKRLIEAVPQMLAACQAFVAAENQCGANLAFVMAQEAIAKSGSSPRSNASQVCDMQNGPCACGAWHNVACTDHGPQKRPASLRQLAAGNKQVAREVAAALIEFDDTHLGQHLLQLIEYVRPVVDGELLESDVMLAELESIYAQVGQLASQQMTQPTP